MLNLTLPTIHTNGSAPATLAEDYREARAKVGAAIQALAPTAPHGRDYYPQGGGAFSRATAEHLLRLSALETVECELETLALAVATQCDERGEPK